MTERPHLNLTEALANDSVLEFSMDRDEFLQWIQIAAACPHTLRRMRGEEFPGPPKYDREGRPIK